MNNKLNKILNLNDSITLIVFSLTSHLQDITCIFTRYCELLNCRGTELLHNEQCPCSFRLWLYVWIFSHDPKIAQCLSWRDIVQFVDLIHFTEPSQYGYSICPITLESVLYSYFLKRSHIMHQQMQCD